MGGIPARVAGQHTQAENIYDKLLSDSPRGLPCSIPFATIQPPNNSLQGRREFSVLQPIPQVWFDHNKRINEDKFFSASLHL